VNKATHQASSDVKGERKARQQYWGGQVELWRASGLTQKQYCMREGISLERFGTWKRRFDREGQNASGGLVPVPSRIISSAFASRPALSLVVNERYRIEIPETFTQSTLEAVLQVLDRL
jgi:hypothetical protein